MSPGALLLSIAYSFWRDMDSRALPLADCGVVWGFCLCLRYLSGIPRPVMESRPERQWAFASVRMTGSLSCCLWYEAISANVSSKNVVKSDSDREGGVYTSIMADGGCVLSLWLNVIRSLSALWWGRPVE